MASATVGSGNRAYPYSTGTWRAIATAPCAKRASRNSSPSRLAGGVSGALHSVLGCRTPAEMEAGGAA